MEIRLHFNQYVSAKCNNIYYDSEYSNSVRIKKTIVKF